MGDPRGISPILEQNLRSKSKLDPGYLLALIAEVIKDNGPKDGFLKKLFVRGSSIVQRASTTYSTGNNVSIIVITAINSIGTADIAAAKDVGILCL
jgi:hypothetical protein